MASFTSFSQNYEDVILWRALGHVERGFYVDCGAYHPDKDSVTKAFYDRGWRGVNIEPISLLLDKFTSERPADINLNVALSHNSGSSAFYEILDTGLSTFSATIAGQHIDAGFVGRRIEVETAPLSDVLASHARCDIHFLKIDVEGAEHAVIGGLDLTVHRPWIILVEATRPLSDRPSHLEWEPDLLSQGYDFVYFDGLNRFYLSREHIDLRERLAIPPNPFDDFVQASHLRALEGAKHEIATIKASSSWRLTAPLRALKSGAAIARSSVSIWLDGFLCDERPDRGRLSKVEAAARPDRPPIELGHLTLPL